jgi:hypothetical protein
MRQQSVASSRTLPRSCQSDFEDRINLHRNKRSSLFDSIMDDDETAGNVHGFTWRLIGEASGRPGEEKH